MNNQKRYRVYRMSNTGLWWYTDFTGNINCSSLEQAELYYQQWSCKSTTLYIMITDTIINHNEDFNNHNPEPPENCNIIKEYGDRNALKKPIEKLKEDYNYLHIMTDEEKSKYKDLVIAAKNIKKELKVNFPDTNFSVKSKSYSGGCSIRVHWTDSIAEKNVYKIIKKYQEGSFNGMEDIYEYNETSFHFLFGSSKYIFACRKISDYYINCTSQKLHNKTFTDLTDYEQKQSVYGYCHNNSTEVNNI